MFASRKKVAKPEVRGEMDFTGRHEGVPGAIVELKNANKNLEMEIQSKHGFKITVLSGLWKNYIKPYPEVGMMIPGRSMIEISTT